MAIISITTKSELDKAYRVDPDFYRLDYLLSMQTLTKVSIQKLSKICFVTDGNHLKISSKFSDNEGVRYLRGQDISTEMLIDDRNQVFIPESAFDSLQRSHIFKGDVLITIVGANTGLIGLVFDSPAKLTANCKLGIVRSLAVNPAYLYAFLTSKYGQFQILRAKRGGGQTGLILPDMRNLLISRFTEKLENLISLVVNNGHQKIKESKKIYQNAEKILLSELGLFDWQPNHTLTWVKQSSEIIKSQRVDAEHFQPKYEEIVDRLPSNVRLIPLGNLTTYTKGIEVGGSAYTDSGIPFWRVSNLNKHGLDSSSVNFIGSKLYNSLRLNYEPQQGEILLSKDATLGLAYYLESPIQGITSSGILRLKILNDIPPHYLEFVINSLFVQLQIEQDAGGSIIKHWKPSEVCKTSIPRLASFKEIEIAELVKESHSARKKAKALLEKAKRAVEIAIEESEEKAISFLEQP